MTQLISTSVESHAQPGIAALRAESPVAKRASYLFAGALFAGLLLRLIVAAVPGSAPRTPWGGGGDAATYLLLAHNLIQGKGYTYAGMPTALRAPAYPLLLAGSLKLFGEHALAAVRWLQFAEGLVVVLLCAAMARSLFGDTVGKITLLIAFFFPTLVEMNGEILTEAMAALLVTICLYLLLRQLQEPRWIILIALGVAIGLGILTRFNIVLIGFFLPAVALLQRDNLSRWTGAALPMAVALLVISPWLIRNFFAFHGAVLLSTGGGINAIQGIVTPQGRALPGDAEKLRQAVGWVPPVQIETNNPSRMDLPSEPVLDRQCWKAAISIWQQIGWGLFPVLLKKISYFWFSTDQLFWTGSFVPIQRALRAAGVIIYWIFLALAVAGWFRLRRIWPKLAIVSLGYAGWVTAFHLPFNMITRYRMPFIDPMVAVLAGAGVVTIMTRTRDNEHYAR